MKYLITGSAGFIGSNIALELIKRGEQVRILDNFSTGRRENLEPLRGQVDLIEGDIRDFWTVAETMAGIDYVLHQAALPSVVRSVKNPLTSNAVNIDGTLNVLEAARQAGVKRVVCASSSSVYGESPTLPKVETMKLDPLSPYAVTKLTCEGYCRVYHRLYGLETVALRYFNIFGPHQDPNSQYSAVIPRFVKAILMGRQPVIYGDGEQSRDFTFIGNAVSANLKACTAPNAPGKVFNIACGDRFTLNQTLEFIQQILGRTTTARYVDPRPGDIRHSLADISAAKADLGYTVDFDFKSGLKETVTWFAQIFADTTPVGGIHT
ncbi:MAG: SDR family oxidoreductase [candidate division Zixibacteria bacterium]|nr:SDR family oxidoreductase [candidate division Zixibacteria bacterium]